MIDALRHLAPLELFAVMALVPAAFAILSRPACEVRCCMLCRWWRK